MGSFLFYRKVLALPQPGPVFQRTLGLGGACRCVHHVPRPARRMLDCPQATFAQPGCILATGAPKPREGCSRRPLWATTGGSECR